MVNKIKNLQKPILDKIAENLSGTLRDFLPNIQGFEIKISERAYFRAFDRSYDLYVNDGTLTRLSNKGDGVQSLVALGLIRHGAEKDASGKALILAIEEPESHLHPRAIHRLRSVLDEIAKRYQVILTTHCPLFVNRTKISSNILVTDGKAVPAKSTSEIRSILGVRSADNLINAEVILLVEGEDDRESISAIIRQKSSILADSLDSGLLALDSLNGGTNLSYKMGLLRDRVTIGHVFLDHDTTGKDAIERAKTEGLLSDADYNLSTTPGQPESEFEDLLVTDLYKSAINSKFGINLDVTQFRGTGKWSERLRRAAQHQGKTWSDRLEKEIKWAVSDLVKLKSNESLDDSKSGSINALVSSLEAKVRSLIN